MANDNSAFSPEFWASEMQPIFYKENILMDLAKTELREFVYEGDTKNRPYRSSIHLQTYTKGTDITVQDTAGTNEYLTVATAKTAAIYYDDIDKLQNKWDLATEYAQEMQRLLNNDIEQAFMAEYSNANSSIVASDMGGSGSGTFVSSTANIINMFAVAKRKLGVLDIPRNQLFAIVGERELELLNVDGAGRETGMGDNIQANGFTGKNKLGFDLYVSNNVPFGATWTPANNPSESQTVTINGIVFTFNATPSGAGSINIGADTAGSIDNLVACINRTGTADTDYIAISNANRLKLTKAGLTATDGTTNMTISGYGDVILATSDSNDPWSAQTSYPLFGMKKAVELLVQMPPRVKFQEAQKRWGKYGMCLTLYGKKTWNNLKDALVNATLDASNWT